MSVDKGFCNLNSNFSPEKKLIVKKKKFREDLIIIPKNSYNQIETPSRVDIHIKSKEKVNRILKNLCKWPDTATQTLRESPSKKQNLKSLISQNPYERKNLNSSMRVNYMHTSSYSKKPRPTSLAKSICEMNMNNASLKMSLNPLRIDQSLPRVSRIHREDGCHKRTGYWKLPQKKYDFSKISTKRASSMKSKFKISNTKRSCILSQNNSKCDDKSSILIRKQISKYGLPPKFFTFFSKQFDNMDKEKQSKQNEPPKEVCYNFLQGNKSKGNLNSLKSYDNVAVRDGNNSKTSLNSSRMSERKSNESSRKNLKRMSILKTFRVKDMTDSKIFLGKHKEKLIFSLKIMVKKAIQSIGNKIKEREISAYISCEDNEFNNYNTDFYKLNLIKNYIGEKYSENPTYRWLKKSLSLKEEDIKACSNSQQALTSMLQNQYSIAPSKLRNPVVLIKPGNNPNVVKSVIKKRSWARIKHKGNSSKCQLVWTQWILSNPKSFQLIQEDDDMLHYRLYNHIPGNSSISNKKNLFKNMYSYYSNQGKDPWKFIPVTYLVSSSSDDNFLRFINENSADFKDPAKNSLWIIKPGECSNRGNGIEVCENVDQIKKYIKQHKRKSYIIQKYITQPLLYQDRKFDIRCFGLFTSINGIKRGYFYQGGYIRTSCEGFNLEDPQDPFIHLTNDAIQSKCEDYGKYENCNKLSFNDFEKYINETHEGVSFYENIYPKIKELVKDTFTCAGDLLDPSQRSKSPPQSYFELFGFDIMIDSDYIPYLIEVNTNPCLETPCSLLSCIIPNVLDHTFRLTFDLCYPNPYNTITCENLQNLSKFEQVYSFAPASTPKI
ncbi:unnamed protein product [Moneuplotes crassus]|uniref:Tubulin-tyrosine ligase family protein n=1 Tax=Euplotes crassus TaxID=5936 RepID=A0AAD1Y310_EUPCR|nr:unnamed protein product [Moneuplotes crassus]